MKRELSAMGCRVVSWWLSQLCRTVFFLELHCVSACVRWHCCRFPPPSCWAACRECSPALWHFQLGIEFTFNTLVFHSVSMHVSLTVGILHLLPVIDPCYIISMYCRGQFGHVPWSWRPHGADEGLRGQQETKQAIWLRAWPTFDLRVCVLKGMQFI